MTRRDVLASATLFTLGRAAAQARPPRCLGGAPAGFPIRSRQAGGRGKFDVVEHVHSLGLGSVEIGVVQPDQVAATRDRLGRYQMRAISNVPLPRDEAGVAQFDTLVKASKDAGMLGTHAAMTARRYEEFDTFDAFKTNFDRCQRQVALAEPVLRKHKFPVFLENHKGWRSAEQAAWLKRLSSEYVGVHFDFGNNLSLCEDPMQTLETLLPYIGACHIKDMAVELYADGFLLSEVPLGEGFLDIKGMVARLQKKDPNMPFNLEMITRDPLQIPIFTKKYWATFDDPSSPLPGRDVARTIELVTKNRPKSPLPKTTGLSPEAQLRLEDDCISKSIAWAKANLNLS